MQKIERNGSCSCGSQKKFKHCCLAKNPVVSSLEDDTEWQKLRQIEGKIWEEAFAFASKKWGPEIIQDGWDAFCLGMDLERNSPDGEHLFPGWFVFRWIPFDYSEKWRYLGPNLTIADLYLQEKRAEKYELFLSSVDQSPFYESASLNVDPSLDF